MQRSIPLNSPPRLFILLFAALALRVSAAIVFDPPMISDDRDYHRIALSIVNGEGFAIGGIPTAYRLPAYPVFLAGVYWVFGESGLAVRFLQALIDALSCLLVYVLGRRLLQERSALTAAWIYAVLPITILYTTVRMSETVVTALVLLFFVTLPDDPKDFRRFVLSGVVAGCAVLSRSTAMLLPLTVLVLPSLSGRLSVERVRPFAITAGVMLLILAPWMIRNEAMFDRFALTSNGGVNFWMGNHSGASGSYSFPPGNPLDLVTDDFERSDLGYRLGLDFWRDEPVAAIILTSKKIAHFFAADYWMATVQTTTADWRPPDRAVKEFRQLPLSLLAALQFPFVAIMICAIPGFVLLSRNARRTWMPVIIVCVLWIGAHVVMYGGARYRFPLYPFFTIAAVQGWQFIFRDRSVSHSRFQIILLSLISFVLLAGWVAEAWILFSSSEP